jgi:hypothetical protein
MKQAFLAEYNFDNKALEPMALLTNLILHRKDLFLTNVYLLIFW